MPQQLGKYQIRRAIGKGAMGIVYEGFDPVIDRIVAIKTIRRDELEREGAEEHSRRFLIEAKAAGRLNHKNIVGIHDYGEEKGLSFIVMEFVQGKELKSLFSVRHPFPLSQIVRLMGELLDALGYSHSRGVVHRDVKPDNIFVTDDGSVKLGDFGIARIDATSRTHAGTVLGTPSYMAPEQIRGETADARSDLYAAGVILYQFLVGERPFSGGMVAVMQKVLMEAPKAPSSHDPSIPEAIDAVVLKALSKAPEARFGSASEFRRALAAAVGLSNADDESESTVIMSTATLKSVQDAATLRADRTGVPAEASVVKEDGESLFAPQALPVGAPAKVMAGRVVVAKMRASGQAMAEFAESSHALAPAAHSDLEWRRGEFAAAAQAREAFVERIEHESRSALGSFEQKIHALEKRLASQDGAWGNESRALEALGGDEGQAPIAPIQARLDKLAISVEQVAKGFANVQSRTENLQPSHAERMAVVDAQLRAQADFVTRLRTETETARERARSAVEARRVAEDAARRVAEGQAVRKVADEDARAAAQAGSAVQGLVDAAAEKKRQADEKVSFDAATATATAAAAAAERQAAEAARKQAERQPESQAAEAAVRAARIEAAARENQWLLPFVGGVVVAIAAGAWFALRPAPTPMAEIAPVIASAAPASAPVSVAPSAIAPASQPATGVAQAAADRSVDPQAPDAASAHASSDDQAAMQRKADHDARKTADAEARAKARADADRQRKADAEGANASYATSPVDLDAANAKARADRDARAKARADAKADADARAGTDAGATAAAGPFTADPRADAADTFRKGYEAYLAGRVPESVRQMERADAMGAPGARTRLCAIYRKPTAAEGKDFLKEANKCQGID